MVQQPQAGKCQLLVLHAHTCVWEAASCTVCNHSPLCQLLPGEVFAPSPAHAGSFPCDRSPWLPVGKSPIHSRILVWFPAGSCILSGKEKHVKFSPTLIPREFTLLLGFCNQRPNAIPHAKAIQRRCSSRQLCSRGMIRVCDKHSSRPQARPGTNHSCACSVRNTCMQ